MPKITVEGFESIYVDEGTRLVVGLSEAGIDIGHRCGGYARCTTCRVRVYEGEPSVISMAELEKLRSGGQLGKIRLACQIVVEEDMTVEPLMLVSKMGWSDPGPQPEETVTPEPDWTPVPGI